MMEIGTVVRVKHSWPVNLVPPGSVGVIKGRYRKGRGKGTLKAYTVVFFVAPDTPVQVHASHLRRVKCRAPAPRTFRLGGAKRRRRRCGHRCNKPKRSAGAVVRHRHRGRVACHISGARRRGR